MARDKALGKMDKGSAALIARAASITLFLVVSAAPPAWPQEDVRRDAPPQPAVSDLGQDNLGYVGAAAKDIEVVLIGKPGLLIELKRWVARDATQQGQMVSETDLTDRAIQDRLESDARFRAVATGLLQRYGYLTAQINPDSQAGRTQRLMLEERAKWLDTRESQPAETQARGCETTLDSDCARRPARLERRESETSLDNRGEPDRNPGLDPGDDENQELNRKPDARPFSPETPGKLPSDMLANGSPSMLPQEGSNTRAARFTSASLEDELNPLDNGANGANGTNSGVYRRPRDGRGSPGGDDDRSGAPESAAGGSGSARDFERDAVADSSPDSATRSLRKEIIVPEMIRRSGPYSDVPSLYEMYMQTAEKPAVPKRFGMDVFARGSRASQTVPMDLPVGPDYVVGPGDALTIDLWGGVSQRLNRAVDAGGRLSLPEVGPVLVSGKSLGEVQKSVQQILRTQFRDVSADVSLARLRTVRVYVVGDVEHPGAYDVSSLSTPLNALFLAGGPTIRGSLRDLKHYRGKELIQYVDVYDLLLHGVKSGIDRMEDGDAILVPPAGAGVTIEGIVRRPAIYELRDETSLADALALAGGILPSASLQHIEVQRVVANDRRTMLSVDLSAAGDGAAATESGAAAVTGANAAGVASAATAAAIIPPFVVKDGDVIRIFPIAPYNESAIYLQGHVLRPGRYAYRDGMKLTDVIASFDDLMPEPSGDYAEIIHLKPPDFSPAVESFRLADVIAGRSAAPLLAPMDTVRIYGRYDFEAPPSVSVWGEVRHPGSFRTTGQIHVSDAVHLAGGATPDALTDNAQVFRTLPDSSLKIFSVNLKLALGGDAASDVVLQPRDRVLVHRNPARVDPPSVYVKGEIAKPGRYPLTDGMRVADLIRVGGGLKRGADSDLADLAGYSVDGSQRLVGDEQPIHLASALGGDPASNLPLRDGATLTIRRITGWDDRGATITVQGEVQHPGAFGIEPGEKLSSILARAGGLRPGGFSYGAILERAEVRDLEDRNRHAMIVRVQEEQEALAQLPDADAHAKMAKAAAIGQWQTTLDSLESTPPIGRVVIHIAGDTRKWKNTADDITVRAEDVLIIPKAPNYVMVSGQVYNPAAVSFRPGKSAAWYLAQGGGPTRIADKKSIFVIRADGSVIGGHGGSGWWSGSGMNVPLRPGDTVVVPERSLGGGPNWNTIFQAATLATSVTSTALIAGKL